MWEYEEMEALAAPGTVLAEFRDSGVAQMIRVTSYNRCAGAAGDCSHQQQSVL